MSKDVIRDFRKLKHLSGQAVDILLNMNSDIQQLPDTYTVTEDADPEVFQIISDTIRALYEFDMLYRDIREPFKKQVDRIHRAVGNKEIIREQ